MHLYGLYVYINVGALYDKVSWGEGPIEREISLKFMVPNKGQLV